MAIVERDVPTAAAAAPTAPRTPAAAPTPQQRLDSALVRVRQVLGTFRVEFRAGVHAPPNEAIRANLPEKIRARITQREWDYNTLEQIVTKSLNAGVGTAQAWADAIGQALVQHVVSQDPDGFVAACGPDPHSVVELAAGAPAYMIIGGMAYRMTPAAMIDKTKPLDLLRKVARERGATEAATLIAAGKMEAEMLIRKAQALKSEAEALKLDASRGLAYCIPAWAGDCPQCAWRRASSYNGGYTLEVQLAAAFLPTSIFIEYDEKRYTWVPNPEARPFHYKFWLPLTPATGKFSVAACHIDDGSGFLPHMTSHKLCGTVEGLPRQVDGAADVERVRKAVQRAMNGVNLGSLLARWENFPEGVRNFLPEQVARYTRSDISVEDLIKTSSESEKQDQVLANTWNL